MNSYNQTLNSRFKFYPILRWLNVHPESNRLVGDDACTARAVATLFLPSEFLTSDHGKAHKDSLILNQTERARNLPSIRPSTSTKYQPKTFWEEWDAHLKAHGRDDFPLEWDVVIRPIIAKLYKTGIIGNCYLPDPPR